jgi:hypothetical protein
MLRSAAAGWQSWWEFVDGQDAGMLGGCAAACRHGVETVASLRPDPRRDVALLKTLRDHPRAGQLEASRLTGVARATVQSRIHKLETAGIVTGYGPDIDLRAAGYTVQAFVTLEMFAGNGASAGASALWSMVFMKSSLNWV